MPAHRVITDDVLNHARTLMDGQGLSQHQAAARLGVSQSALSRALARAEHRAAGDQATTLPEPDVEVRGDEGHFMVDGGATPHGAAALMAENGFDPGEWEIVKASMTRWGWNRDRDEPYKRLRVDVRRRLSILGLWPADHDAVPPVDLPLLAPATGESQMGVIFSDQHALWQDRRLHAKACLFLRDTQPDFGVLAGDTLDFPSPSRHRHNPKFHATPQECLNSGYRMLRDYVEAHPMKWRKLLGNHDVRIRNFLLESSAPDLATLTPAYDGEVPDLTPALAIRRLLRLDQLGIECLEPEGEYADEMAILSRHLGVIHGERSGKDAAFKELERYGHSLIFGHLHRAGIQYRTRYDMDGPTTHAVMQLPTMAQLDLGYQRRPDSQQGFGVVNLWPDGRFHLELAIYTAGELFWRDERW